MYEKQTWVTGEVITKEKLNHMEDGIANGGLIFPIGFTYVKMEPPMALTLNKTWNEIKSVLESNLLPVAIADATYGGESIKMVAIVMGVMKEDNSYLVLLNLPGTSEELSTDSPDGYPSVGEQDSSTDVQDPPINVQG